MSIDSSILLTRCSPSFSVYFLFGKMLGISSGMNLDAFSMEGGFGRLLYIDMPLMFITGALKQGVSISKVEFYLITPCSLSYGFFTGVSRVLPGRAV